MRILQVTGEYPPMQGGVGDFTRELARALTLGGHDVRVLARFAPGAPAQETTDGVAVHRAIASWGWDTRRRVEAFLNVYPADVVNLQYQAAAYQMHPAVNLLPGQLRKRVPVVVTFHDLRVPYLFPKAGPLRWQAILAMARGASACIVTNPEDLDTLKREGVTHAALAPIGSNIAPGLPAGFDRAAWLSARNIDPAQRLIGYFGFMNDSKGGDTLVRALAALRAGGVNAAVLHIGGQLGDSDPTNADFAAKLAALTRGLGVSQHWIATGFLDAPDVSAGFAACDVVALPYKDGASYRRGTLMAALAHGCAIVSTESLVDIPAFEDGVNMRLVAPDHPGALADALSMLLRDSAVRERLRAGAARLSGQFSWDGIAKTSASIFAEAARRVM
jgi:glycosyltransferase involved in cell wall biosynthesis